ncbi:MAG: T9SS type A sorting domain-containing protein [Chitinophagales bacterium]|nr:T9SS type A sorting domain-containing protein [Chitinophagales bacterium]
MRRFTIFLALFFSIEKSLGQIYTVPFAQVQPAWVFPLWFEDGSGAKDTLYFCYDPTASTGPPLDTLMGEIRHIMDTSKFNVYFDCSFSIDFSVLKVKIDSADLAKDICVWKAYLPLKIKWDRTLFYSDSLPYPDQSPAPRAEGHFFFDLPTASLDPEPNCLSPILMTDSTITSFDCYATDSIILGGGFSIMNFTLAAWQGRPLNTGTGISNSKVIEGLQIYPNIISRMVIIDNQKSNSYSYLIMNASGETILKGIISPVTKTFIYVDDWNAGLYLLQSINHATGKNLSFKLLKPN